MRLDFGDFIIRSFEKTDATSIAKQANDKEVWINLRDRFPHPYRHQDAVEWIALAASLSPESNFAIAVDGEAVGGIGILQQSDVHAHSAEFGYWLGKNFWGKGIMTRAVGAMTTYYFENFDLVRLYAAVYDWNPGSARVLEKCGWELEGRLKKSVFKDGKYCDQLIYAKLNPNK
ncbi:MAG: GNAT family N-acetyltransferase [Cyanobacteria bacterium SZAS LIN-2]|nr:GNAT family N-acetyltransferase [Cyanobacteria bacterium SZAS LIN-2]